MGNAKETGKLVGKFILHPRRSLEELDSRLNRTMALILMGGSACEPGMRLPMTEVNPEENKKREVVEE